jgi:hypothetical protein
VCSPVRNGGYGWPLNSVVRFHLGGGVGAWGHRNFENDEALDWTWELEEKGLTHIEATLQAVENAATEYIETPDCTTGLAAAEVVALLLGRPSDDVPSEVTKWAEGKPKPPTSLVTRAIASIGLIETESELRDLWAETGDFEAWKSVIRNLRDRLQQSET